jgi:hypothetical protein
MNSKKIFALLYEYLGRSEDSRQLVVQIGLNLFINKISKDPSLVSSYGSISRETGNVPIFGDIQVSRCAQVSGCQHRGSVIVIGP